jgi:O-antigen/teichoic acid export membrane protein
MIKHLKNNNFARNSFILFAGTMIVNGLNYFFHFAIGRMVSQGIYGEIQSLNSIINIVLVPTAAITLIATKFSAEYKAEDSQQKTEQLYKYLNRKIALFGLPLLLLTLILTPYLSKFLKIDNNLSLIFVWFLMSVSFFVSINKGIVNGWQNFFDSSRIGVWGAIVKFVFGIALVKFGFGLNGALGGYLFGAIGAYLVSVSVLRFLWKFKQKTVQNISEINLVSLKKYALPVLVGNLGITVLGNVDMIVAKHNLAGDLAGQYGALSIVSKIIFFVTGVFATVLFSMAAENHHKRENSIKIFRQAFFLVFVATGLATLVYFVFPRLILGVLFGAKYQSAASLLGWFAVVAALFSLTNIICMYLFSIHKTKIAYWLLVISILMGLVILFYGMTIFAILKIVIVAEIISILIGFYFVRREKSAYQYETDLDYNPGV